MSKKACILVDIHKTLISDNGAINYNMIDFINYLSVKYIIILNTASYYKDFQELKKEVNKLNVHYTDIKYNTNELLQDDDLLVKEHIYNEIKLLYSVAFVIDNNKHVIKMFVNLGVDTLRFKKGQ